MTSVPGYGSMSGGSAPALIWHDFMATAVGKDCAEFPKPRQPFSPVPFFGKYSTTGSSDSDGGYYYQSPYSGTGDDSAGGGDYQGYDPRLYDQPPQEAPLLDAPEEATPSPGAGGGAESAPDE
jgi:penicillin-binding protein 1A